MTPILETRRVTLREFRRDDLDELAVLVADDEQMTFYPRPKTRDEASAWIDGNLDLYRKRGFGVWLIESRWTSEFVGYCGIKPCVLHDPSEIEIGWHIKKTFWREGIATEAAAAVLDVAVERFALPRLIALVHPDHVASRRVAENVGMHAETTTVLEGDYPAVIYATPFV